MPVPQVGQTAPDFALKEQEGKGVSRPHGEAAERSDVPRGKGFSGGTLFLFDRQSRIRSRQVHDLEMQPDDGAVLDGIRRLG